MKRIQIITLLALSIVSAHADVRNEIRQLAREKIKLTMETNKIFNQHKLHENPEYQELQQKAHEVAREFNQTRRNHPALKDYYAKSDAAQKKMIRARMDKDKEGSRKATNEYTGIRIEMEKAASAIPELEAAKEKAAAASQAVQDKKLELLDSVPEGKTQAAKIRELEAKIVALRKQLNVPKP